MLDANLNRAREGLRVIEDFTRFVLNDADAARRLKILRHDLQSIVEACGANELRNARDTPGDVGVLLKTDAELSRGGLRDAVAAAFGRLTEALRVIGEVAKVRQNPPAAATAEQIRYAAYDLEQVLLSRGERRTRFGATRLYVIITESLCHSDWRATAEAVLRGGAVCLQLREKTLGDRELLTRARELRDLTREHNALLIINDRPDIAALADADGVHVGQDDLAIADVRRIVGGDRLIGVSTHTREQFERALGDRPDYVALGPMFPTTTKPQDVIAGAGLLAELVSRADVPVIAIGGILTGNVADIAEAGADCACVCSAIIGAEDAERAARHMLDAFDAARPVAAQADS